MCESHAISGCLYITKVQKGTCAINSGLRRVWTRGRVCSFQRMPGFMALQVSNPAVGREGEVEHDAGLFWEQALRIRRNGQHSEGTVCVPLHN